MDKNKIKQYLTKTFVTEAAKTSNLVRPSEASGAPAIKLAKKIATDNGKINKKGVGEVGKDMKSYEKGLEKTDVNDKTMAQNKFNYSDDNEQTYHDEMEIMNGQEMIQYDRKPDSKFTERAMEAIEGSARMGNSPEYANVVEKGWGGDPEFGKNLVKKIKASVEKRNKETPTIHLQGRDIEADRKDYGNKPYAFKEGDKEKEIIKDKKPSNDKKPEEKPEDLSQADASGDDYEKSSREIQHGIRYENKQTPQIKESMKRLKFKKEFNGVGNALKLIPESYRVDSKVFEMTDGNESYKIRWEGSLTEGKAVILMAADKKMVNEDITRMKALMGYKSEDTLGTVKGKARIDENDAFTDVWAKTKKMLKEEEDIEDAEAEKEAPFEDADVKQAPEAKKHVQGSTSTDKGTQAPKPKEGEWDKTKNPAPAEAKKHVQGSVSTDKGTQAPKPKEGEWDLIKVPQAAEAKKHIVDTAGVQNSKTAKTGPWEEIKTGGKASGDKGTQAPKPKEGEWEKAKTSQAPEAKKDIKGSVKEGLKKKQ